jgi:hypothetical protein
VRRAGATVALPVALASGDAVVAFVDDFATGGPATEPPSKDAPVRIGPAGLELPGGESPAAKAGVLPGDEVVAIAGKKVSSWDDLLAVGKTLDGSPVEVEVRTGDAAPRTVRVTPRRMVERTPGVAPIERSEALAVVPVSGAGDALGLGFKRTVSEIRNVFRTIARFFTGDISFSKNVSGPVTIATISSSAASKGLSAFLVFLAFISVNPRCSTSCRSPLDGGTMMFLDRAVRRKRLVRRGHRPHVAGGLRAPHVAHGLRHERRLRACSAPTDGSGRAAPALAPVRPCPARPTAAFDVVACALLARGPGLGAGAPPLPWRDALLLAATSVLVYLAGMGGNDLADRRRDRTLHPDRPLPAGRIAPAAALVVVFLLAAGAVVLGGGPAGDRRLVVGALVAAAAYDLAAKRRVVPGAVVMGSVRALNAATGVVPLVVVGLASPLGSPPAPRGSRRRHVPSAAEASGTRGPRAPRRPGAMVVAFGGGGGSRSSAPGRRVHPLSRSRGVVGFDRVPRKGPVKRQVLEMLLGYFWLDAVLAGGAAPGSDWALALGALGAAYAAIVLSQLAVRALR